MWGNQTAHRDQIPLNLGAQYLQDSGTIVAPVQFPRSWRAAVVGPAILMGLMPNDEEAPAPSRDSACPEGERNRPHPSKHMQRCPLVKG